MLYLLIAVVFGVHSSPSTIAPIQTPDAVITSSPATFLSFPPSRHWYTLHFEIGTVGDKRHTTASIQVEQEGHKAARDLVFDDLQEAGFAVEKAGDNSLVICGFKRDDGTLATITSTKLILREVKVGKPTLLGLGGAKAETNSGK